jgi:NADPH:quinone reductase-like Zn-dependent oxidoreductase
VNLDSLTPEDTTVVLVDYAVGFANVLRSHDSGEHVDNVVGLAKTAKLYGSGLVVTNGADSRPSGPPLLSRLVSLVDSGKLRVEVAERVPLADLPALHARAAEGAVHGKVIVVVPPAA